MHRYKYLGEEPRHLPTVHIFVEKKGDIVETEQEINHPDFELLNGQMPIEEKKEPVEEQKSEETQEEQEAEE